LRIETKLAVGRDPTQPAQEILRRIPATGYLVELCNLVIREAAQLLRIHRVGEVASKSLANVVNLIAARRGGSCLLRS
jgi:hypothetical protein